MLHSEFTNWSWPQINRNTKVIKSENMQREKKFPQKVMHTIYGPGNPISLGASIEPAAIFTLQVFGLTALFSVQAFWEFFFGYNG